MSRMVIVMMIMIMVLLVRTMCLRDGMIVSVVRIMAMVVMALAVVVMIVSIVIMRAFYMVVVVRLFSRGLRMRVAGVEGSLEGRERGIVGMGCVGEQVKKDVTQQPSDREREEHLEELAVRLQLPEREQQQQCERNQRDERGRPDRCDPDVRRR